MILQGDAIRGLVPHGGTMCLIDVVSACDALAITCASQQHLALDNPLRRNGRLSSIHAIEFAAQATAIHGAINMPSPPQPRMGWLVSVRNCRFHVHRLDLLAGPLVIEARLSATADAFSTYEFAVSNAGRPVAEGRLGVMTEIPSQ